ncbi:Protocadherin-18 [Trichinella spiralis]|uniref:Protocadherin-18 n=1 Tax=Trichinella spiralis TaxID=6334 RepID=A0ABR3KAS1_TRISP
MTALHLSASFQPPILLLLFWAVFCATSFLVALEPCQVLPGIIDAYAAVLNFMLDVSLSIERRRSPLPCREPLASLATGYPKLIAILCRFLWHVLSELTSAFERIQSLINCNVFGRIIHLRCCIAFNNDKAAEEDRSWGLSDPGDFAYT